MRYAVASIPTVILLFGATAPAALPIFTIANDESGVHYVHTLNGNNRFSRFFGTGPAAADFDRDGDIDLFLPQAYGFPNELYRNNGDGTFTEMAAAAGVDSLKESRAALWIDFDNDGRLDLFVANDPDAPAGQQQADPQTTSNLLYRNLGDGTFLDVSAATGVGQMPNPQVDQTVGGLAAADVNNDGFLDIYVSCWGNPNALFLNNNGVFQEGGAAAGVTEPGDTWAPVFFDINRDGWMDLLLNVDFGPNRLLINQQNGTFVDTAPACGFDTAFNEMGMTLGDYDNDGDFDVLATNIESPYPNADPLIKYTVLLQNESNPTAVVFSECALAAGVARTGWGWGCTWSDCNNDGWVDLFVTNGFHQNLDYLVDPSRCFINNGGVFSEASSAVGFDGTLRGRGLIAFDYDLDGDLDLYETNFGDAGNLFRNDLAGSQNWIAVDLIGATLENKYAVGAEVSVTTGATTQMRLVTAGTSFLSQEPYRLFFGLAGAQTADDITIRWHDGSIQNVTGVRANRVAKIRQNVGVLPDLDLDGDVDGTDLTVFVRVLLGQDNDPMRTIIADVNADGTTDIADVPAFVSSLLQYEP